MTISAPRTGKFTTAIAPALLTYPASAIVIDPKGQAAAVTKRARLEMGHRVIYLNPFGEHGFLDDGFNPLAFLDPRQINFFADVAYLAEALVVETGGDRHWTNGARSLVQCLIMWVVMTEEIPTLHAVRRALCLPESGFKDLMTEISAHPYFPMAQLATRFASDNFRDSAGMVSTAIEETKILADPVMVHSLSRHSFDWQDLKTGQVTVYLILPAQYIGSHARWLRLLITSAITQLSNRVKGPLPVLFVLDEFTQLGKLSKVFDSLNLSAGYGIQFWLIFQSLAVLESVYGDGYEAILATAGITQLFRVNDATTAEYFSKKAGSYTKKTASYNVQEISKQQEENGFTGVSASLNEIAVPLLSPQDIYGWPSGEGLLFVNGLQYPVSYGRYAYYDEKSPYFSQYRGRFDPDPFHVQDWNPKAGHGKEIEAPRRR